jgi:leucyl-tRNA synthetase
VPDEYIAKWGADTFRMYLMFLGPFQEGGDFRDEGISGPRRFLDRVWTLVGDSLREPAVGGSASPALQTKLHQTKKKVAEDIEALHYNTAIAALMELVNALRAEPGYDKSVMEELVVMLAPFAPHFAEECWERFGHDTSVFEARWPEWDERLVVEDRVEVVVQVNGKTRAKITVARDADADAVIGTALEEQIVQRFIEGKEIRKRIVVPNRLVNFVVG